MVFEKSAMRGTIRTGILVFSDNGIPSLEMEQLVVLLKCINRTLQMSRVY